MAAGAIVGVMVGAGVGALYPGTVAVEGCAGMTGFCGPIIALADAGVPGGRNIGPAIYCASWFHWPPIWVGM